jgi:hypothetical protein
MGRNLENFGKIRKMSGKKTYCFVVPVLLDASFAHQCSCNIFVSQEYFFFGESFEKCVLAPTPTHHPASEATLGKMFVCCWFCKCSERSESRKYVCCAFNFVKAASEASLTKAWEREN